jgi:hypothetical protein
MTERAPQGYCINCPVAQVMNKHIEYYHDDVSTKELDTNTPTILSFPDNLTDEELDDAAKAFSMTDREAYQAGVSETNLENMRNAITESLSQLGEYALESNCTQPRPIANEKLGCQAVGSAIAYESYLMATEKYILGFED